MKDKQIRDATGKLIGYITEKDTMGVSIVRGPTGKTLGFSKDPENGGLPYTVAFGSGSESTRRISHGDNPELLLGMENEKKKNNPFGY